MIEYTNFSDEKSITIDSDVLKLLANVQVKLDFRKGYDYYPYQPNIKLTQYKNNEQAYKFQVDIIDSSTGSVFEEWFVDEGDEDFVDGWDIIKIEK